jgi:hypothetical protein
MFPRQPNHVTVATDTHETIEEQLLWCSLLGPLREYIRRTETDSEMSASLIACGSQWWPDEARNEQELRQ